MALNKTTLLRRDADLVSSRENEARAYGDFQPPYLEFSFFLVSPGQ